MDPRVITFVIVAIGLPLVFGYSRLVKRARALGLHPERRTPLVRQSGAAEGRMKQ